MRRPSMSRSLHSGPASRRSCSRFSVQWSSSSQRRARFPPASTSPKRQTFSGRSTTQPSGISSCVNVVGHRRNTNGGSVAPSVHSCFQQDARRPSHRARPARHDDAAGRRRTSRRPNRPWPGSGPNVAATPTSSSRAGAALSSRDEPQSLQRCGDRRRASSSVVRCRPCRRGLLIRGSEVRILPGAWPFTGSTASVPRCRRSAAPPAARPARLTYVDRGRSLVAASRRPTRPGRNNGI
jgi:hypothetical protein